MSNKRFDKSIELLNKAVADELLAIHQYMYFHFHCDDQGYELLSNLFMKIAVQEMHHVEVLSHRIIFLKGDVEMKVVGEVKKIRDPEEMIKCAAGMEEESARDYNNWVGECSANADAASKKIFEDLVHDEESHFDLFDTELDNMTKYGENYFALQAIERSKAVSAR